MKGHAYRPSLVEPQPDVWHAISGCECGWVGSRGGGQDEWKQHRQSVQESIDRHPSNR